MMRFKIFGAIGDSGGSYCRNDFAGVQGFFVVVAENRADAFIKLFRHLMRQGDDVTVLESDKNANPLGFSPVDTAAIAAAGISLTVGFPKSGFQVGEIILA